MRQWTHAHSVATGLVAGLILDHHVLYVLALGALIGGLAVYSSRTLRALTRAGAREARTLARLAAAKAEAEIDRKRAAAVELNARAEHRIRTSVEQKKAEDSAWIRGYAEGEHS